MQKKPGSAKKAFEMLGELIEARFTVPPPPAPHGGGPRRRVPMCGIIYCATTRECEQVAEALNAKGEGAWRVSAYHGQARGGTRE